jgi:hypothetical protein
MTIVRYGILADVSTAHIHVSGKGVYNDIHTSRRHRDRGGRRELLNGQLSQLLRVRQNAILRPIHLSRFAEAIE